MRYTITRGDCIRMAEGRKCLHFLWMRPEKNWFHILLEAHASKSSISSVVFESKSFWFLSYMWLVGYSNPRINSAPKNLSSFSPELPASACPIKPWWDESAIGLLVVLKTNHKIFCHCLGRELEKVYSNFGCAILLELGQPIRGHREGGPIARSKNFKTPFFKRYWKILSRGYSNGSRTSPFFFFLKYLNKYGC